MFRGGNGEVTSKDEEEEEENEEQEEFRIFKTKLYTQKQTYTQRLIYG